MPRTFALLLSCTWIGLAACAWPATAAAQEDQSQLDEAARLTFEQARADFTAGRYEQALTRFRQAYQLSPRPGLLYNIAQTLDRLRRDEETVEALRDYLEAAPDAPNRTEVEARIRVLDAALAERRAAEPPPPDEDPVETAPPSAASIGVLHPAIFISVGGLALAGGGVLIWSGVETLALNDAYEATTAAEGYAVGLDRYNAANDQQLLTNVFIGVTAGLGVAAVALAIFTDWGAFGGGGEDTARLASLLWASQDGARVGLGGSF